MRRFILRSFDFLYLFGLMRTAIGALFVAAFACRGLARSGQVILSVKWEARRIVVSQRLPILPMGNGKCHDMSSEQAQSPVSTQRGKLEIGSHFAEAQYVYGGLLIPRHLRAQPYQKFHFMTWLGRHVLSTHLFIADIGLARASLTPQAIVGLS
jgi:hypothetical protein